MATYKPFCVHVVHIVPMVGIEPTMHPYMYVYVQQAWAVCQ